MSSSIAPIVETNQPRPEFPRPDWQRTDWLNLNGTWAFRLDPSGANSDRSRHAAEADEYDARIQVPFSWASPLSGIGIDAKGVGWYRRELQWQPSVLDSRLYLRFGAVDYECDVWVNGAHAGSHRGGYGTFEFEVTSVWRTDAPNTIVVRAEDEDLTYQARGKQGYGEVRGIWQPVWLEARPQAYVGDAKFATRIDGTVEVRGRIEAGQAGKAKLRFDFADGAVRKETELALEAGTNEYAVSFQVANPRLWSPDTPNLYEGEIRLTGEFGEDAVGTYFGIREVGTAAFGDRSYRWITLNGKPIYLNGTLDQSFHPTGYFTYPTDEEMRDEIYLMKRLGLNFVRIHIKPEEPRKLYWADKLGLLVMEDMPCFWGNPDEKARAAYEQEALEVIERDYNHPSIFSWIMFNETWGLKTNSTGLGLTGDLSGQIDYLPETQEWVRDRYHWAKRLDPTRIVEDNSTCNWDHVESDINTWHFYINGYEEVRSHVQEVVDETYPGSSKNYIGDNKQTGAPLMNSECGNVWGIADGGAGDSDLAWHYRYMLNEFRRHDKMCGFVFTEFRDVVNEFNGYYRLDGSDKQFGYEDFVPGMTLADLHTADFVVIDAPPCQTVQAGSEATVQLLRSSFDDRYHGETLRLEWELTYDNLGLRVTADSGSADIAWDGFGVYPLAPITLRLPAQDAVGVLGVRLVDAQGRVVTRNFTTFDVRGGEENGVYTADGGFVSVPVGQFASHTFAYEWSSIQGAKASGGKAGEFVYDVRLPELAERGTISEVEIWFEASAKRLLARNVEGEQIRQHGIEFMHGASANVEFNPNTYYMTDDEKHASRVNVLVDGERIGSFVLADDPADSRGVLSWHYQTAANKLEEAGSYGYLCRAVVPGRLAARLDRSRSFKLQLQADEGGIALYGRNAGRYPIDLLVRYR
ncbi:glycoside hydrolase family 2 protein [Cohnella sp. REN36]|uniref:glycoside hydrolase family 2 protein n=1 Tax=Cohnella sp. REN36 TaxID=2887347 RepID=UPI001D150B7E|nr:glycoside hydrolase family 2 TIM barrel-domain containing protein [Cohnella sp. REN36]MCC3376747.1 beta galactosidase jelly roll domain-containing protein [Cohnella sp. REN36]